MCDFHGVIIYQDGKIFHTKSNSHSEAAQISGRQENQPNREPFFYEWEWSGVGEIPPIGRLLRGANPPETVVKAALKHAGQLQQTLLTGQLCIAFAKPEYVDVRGKLLHNRLLPQSPRLAELVRVLLGYLPVAEATILESGLEALPVQLRKPEQSVARFLHWVLVDPNDGAIRFAKTASIEACLRQSAALHAREYAGDTPTEGEWSAAESAAWSAAWSAAHKKQAAKLLEILSKGNK